MIFRKARTEPDPESRPGGGRCPLCDAVLGARPEKDKRTGRYLPPSLRLEVAGDPRQRPLAWRLSVVGTRDERVSTNPPFVEDDVRWSYLLCGNGHYFLDWIKLPGEEGKFVWRNQSFVAAVGPVASGKSYLLARTLNQPLEPSGRYGPLPADVDTVAARSLSDPLESVPKDTLERSYSDTRRPHVHRPIPPTLTDELLPGTILQGEIAGEIPDAAAELQRKVMKRDRPPSDPWGQSMRQPIFLRTRRDGQPVLTCVADLSGELFQYDQRGILGAKDLPMLRHCRALVWVIDPFHSEQRFATFLADALNDDQLYHLIAEGSSRPDAARAADPSLLQGVIADRDELFERLATELTKDEGDFVAPIGGIVRNLVVISKCDLVERALKKRDLVDLGDAGQVLSGIGYYLDHVLDRYQPAAVSAAVNDLFGYLRVGEFGGPEQVSAQRQRVAQTAAAMLEHYSDSARFWSLVHGGEEDRIPLRNESNAVALDERTIAVPSLDEHIVACLKRDGSRELRLRDLVMSALGCGIMFGLGHDRHVVALLRQRWREIQFFLCSPLGTVPQISGSQGVALAPGGQPWPPPGPIQMVPSSAGFPRVGAASAALTQLQLRIMQEALP
jgi:hypothetical protein